MTLPNSPLAETLWLFANSYIELFEKTNGCLPVVEKDNDWVSPCQQNDFDEKSVYWKPVKSDKELSFENIESALEITLHQDIKIYFSTFLSESIEANCEEGRLSLLFAWNENDFQRLQENIIGHVLMKKRLKQSNTIFFAVTDEEDLIISLDNDNGEVWVERVGCKPHKKLANSLSEFIEQLTPVCSD